MLILFRNVKKGIRKKIDKKNLSTTSKIIYINYPFKIKKNNFVEVLCSLWSNSGYISYLWVEYSNLPPFRFYDYCFENSLRLWFADAVSWQIIFHHTYSRTLPLWPLPGNIKDNEVSVFRSNTKYLRLPFLSLRENEVGEGGGVNKSVSLRK